MASRVPLGSQHSKGTCLVYYPSRQTRIENSVMSFEQGEESRMNGLLSGIRSGWLRAPGSAQGRLCFVKRAGTVGALGLMLPAKDCLHCPWACLLFYAAMLSNAPGMDRLSLTIRCAYSFYHVLSSFANQKPHGLFKGSCISTLTWHCSKLTHRWQQ